jgi:predicted RNase H-like HicB family nuclease
VILECDAGGYVGYAPDLPGCICAGDTFAETAANVEKAIGNWIDQAAFLGWPIPAASRAPGPSWLAPEIGTIGRIRG